MPFYSFKCSDCSLEKKIFASPGQVKPLMCGCGQEMQRVYESFYAFADSGAKNKKEAIEGAVDDNKQALKELKSDLKKKANHGLTD